MNAASRPSGSGRIPRFALPLAVLLAFAFPLAVQARAPQAQVPAAKESAAAEGPTCGDCHEQGPAYNKSPHAAKAARNGAASNAAIEAACASCHGDGKAHMEAGGDASLIKSLKGGAATSTCLTCHVDSSAHSSFKTGPHAAGQAVNCETCHSIHASDAKAGKLLVKESTELCSSCHGSVASAFKTMPVTHHFGRGGLTCLSCHNAHGRAGREGLAFTKAGELPCLSCHADLRGPHVFPHQQNAGDCLSCHVPHASPNNKLLTRSRVDQLCFECHSPITSTTAGSGPPSSHDLRSARYRNCTVCHTAIHGSNRSPELLK